MRSGCGPRCRPPHLLLLPQVLTGASVHTSAAAGRYSTAMVAATRLLALGLALLGLHVHRASSAGFGRQAPVRADHAAVEALITDIVANMTVDEKARELDTTEGINFLTNGACDAEKSVAWLNGSGIGRIHDVYATDPAVTNAIQREVTKASRFGIGAIMGEECTHGYQKDGHTMFPAPIGSAASFSTELLGEVGAAIGKEARSFGTTECWSPIMGLAREPRCAYCTRSAA